MEADDFIQFHKPSIDRDEIDEVVATLQSGWLTTGPRTARFESDFRSYVAASHALAVNSCTAGLHVALAALHLGPGDEVITTPLTFCATVNTILQVGATPVLADIGDDCNIDPESIRCKLTGRTRAIVPVHFAGLPCRMEEIWAMAKEHGLFVIEDAAHAAGTRYRGHPIGAGPSDAVAFSFYATKNLTTGEGGMVTTQNQDLADRMRVLCLHGISKHAWTRYKKEGSWTYDVIDSGFKYNLSDIQSALGIHQLRKLESFVAQRTEYARRYNEAFSEMDELEVPAEAADTRHAWHLYPLKLNTGELAINRAVFIEHLRDLKIGASVHFIPIPLHRYYAESGLFDPKDCPKAIQMFDRLVSLPLYPALTADEVQRVIEAVKQVVYANLRSKTYIASRDSREHNTTSLKQ